MIKKFLLIFLIIQNFSENFDLTNLYVTHEVWFDLETFHQNNTLDYKGRFLIAMFGGLLPKTTLNFVELCNGYVNSEKTLLTYKNSTVHRIMKNFVIQMGDVINGDGTNGESIYGKTFSDENFILKHRSHGWVSMANYGKDTNNSQFYIILTKTPWLDYKYVVFGKVIEGMQVLNRIAQVPIDLESMIPLQLVKIANCGYNRTNP
ncbi:hypothetical protein A3Q56_06538, partial [Intoshia linei]